MVKQITEKFIMNALDKGYQRALKGGVRSSAHELAQKFLDKHQNAQDAIKELISSTSKNSAVSGGVTTLGSALTSAIGIADVIYLQIRMISAIAILKGYDPYDEHIKTLCLMCLAKSDLDVLIKEAGSKMLTKGLSKSLLDQIDGIGAIRKRALLNHFGSARSVESASFDEIKSVEGVEEKVAKKIYNFFHE